MEEAQVVAFIGEAELALQTIELHVTDDQVGLARSPISNDGALYAGNDGLDVRFVDAKNGGAIKRHAIHELDEGVLNVFKRGVLVEMFAVDGGDDGDDGSEHEEAAVAFVGFDDKIFAFAQARRGSGLVDAAADDKRGIEMRRGKHGSYHRSCGGFAVGASDGDAVFQTHQFREHFGARNNRDFPIVGFDHFRIVRLHRRGSDDDVCAIGVQSLVALVNGGAQVL